MNRDAYMDPVSTDGGEVHKTLTSALRSPLASHIHALRGQMNLNLGRGFGDAAERAGGVVRGALGMVQKSNSSSKNRNADLENRSNQEIGVMFLMFVLSLILEFVLLFALPQRGDLLGSLQCSLNYQTVSANWNGTTYVGTICSNTVGHNGVGVVIGAWTVLTASYLYATLVALYGRFFPAYVKEDEPNSGEEGVSVHNHVILSVTTAVMQSLCWVFIATSVGIHQTSGLFMLIASTFQFHILAAVIDTTVVVSVQYQLHAKEKKKNTVLQNMDIANGFRIVFFCVILVPFSLIWITVFSSLTASTTPPRAVTSGTALMFMWQFCEMIVMIIIILCSGELLAVDPSNAVVHAEGDEIRQVAVDNDTVPLMKTPAGVGSKRKRGMGRLVKNMSEVEMVQSWLRVGKHLLLMTMTFLILGMFYNDLCRVPMMSVGPV